MNKPFAYTLGAATLTVFLSYPAAAQVSLQSTPQPTVTAENEPWYSSGGPVTFAGSVYYPAGAVTHFLRNEMVRTGTVGNVAIYARTTQEAGSVIYVPLAGGVMKPYERRRSGDLAGTVGSSAPSFRVVLPSEETLPTAVSNLQLAQPAPLPIPVGTTGILPPLATTPSNEAALAPAVTPTPVGTSGVAPSLPARTRIQTSQRPVGLNAVFVDFQNARWFAAGPAVEYTSNRFTRIGEHRGFDVYQENGQQGTIYLSLLDGAPGLLAPYRRR